MFSSNFFGAFVGFAANSFTSAVFGARFAFAAFAGFASTAAGFATTSHAC